MLILSATSKQRRGLAEDRTSPREKGRGKVHPGAPVKWLRLEQPQTGAGGTGTTGGGWPSPREGPGALTLMQTWEDLEASPRSGRGLLLAVTQDARARAGRSGAEQGLSPRAEGAATAGLGHAPQGAWNQLCLQERPVAL